MSQALNRHYLSGLARHLGRALPAPVRHVAGLARGTVVAQLVTLLAVPVLARLYGLEAFGVFGVFSTASIGLAVAAAGRFEQGILPAPSHRDAACLLYVSVTIVGIFCVTLACALLAIGPAFADRVVSPPVRAAICWLPLGVATQAGGQIVLQWATRLHRDAAIARFYAARAILMNGAQIAFGVLATGQNGLVLGQIVGCAGAACLLWAAVPRPVIPATRAAAVEQAMRVAKDNIDLPRFGLPRTLLESGAMIFQPVMVAALFGSAAMGGYWMALRILGIPGAVLGEPIRQIFFRKASERSRSGLPLFPLLIRAVAVLMTITLPFAGVLLVGSQTLFLVILGPSWALASIYVKVMVFGWIAFFAAGLLPGIVILLGLQKQYFLFEIALRTVEAAAMLIGYFAGNIMISLALWAFVNSLYVVGLLWFIRSRETAARAERPSGGFWDKPALEYPVP